MDTGFPTAVFRVGFGLGFAFTPPFPARDGAVRAPVGVFAFALPFLAGARGLCVWIRVLPLSRLSWLGLVVCAFGYGLWG